MRTQKTGLESAAALLPGTRNTHTVPRGRRHAGTVSRWLDWAPMIVLGLSAAFCGIQKIGVSVMPYRPAAQIYVQAQQPVNHNITAKAPVKTTEPPAHNPES